MEYYSKGEQKWRSGESARLPPMCPGFDSWTRRHMWVELDVGTLLCSERFFFGYSGFLLSLKTNISKFQFHLECTDISERVLVDPLVLRGKTNYIHFTISFLYILHNYILHTRILHSFIYCMSQNQTSLIWRRNVPRYDYCR